MEQASPTKGKPEPRLQRLKRIVIGVAVGFALLAGTCWVLIHTLGDREPRYRGETISYWAAQVRSSDPAVTNQALLFVNSVVIPRLLDRMFHDTRDSQLREWLIRTFNDNLPGVQMCYSPSQSRRAQAAEDLGELGPCARTVVPDLIRALKGADTSVRPSAARALGRIQSEPQRIIPLLIATLDDPQDGVPEAAVDGLGEFGSQSRAALPKLMEMTKIRDKDMQRALRSALKRIDPQSATRSGSK
jgi:HEAT repeats